MSFDQMSLFGVEAPSPPVIQPDRDAGSTPTTQLKPDDEREVAAMRRALDKKGAQLGRDINAEAKARLGIPIYKLPREIIEQWLKMLDEQIAEAGEVNEWR